VKRDKCCGKFRYATQEAAEAALSDLQFAMVKRDKQLLRAYCCPEGWWHHTSRRDFFGADLQYAVQVLADTWVTRAEGLTLRDARIWAMQRNKATREATQVINERGTVVAAYTTEAS